MNINAPESVRSRFHKVMNGQLPADRLPRLEWAHWWDLTIKRWHSEGLPEELDVCGIKRYFGLDLDYQIWFPQAFEDAPAELMVYGKCDEEAYDKMRPYLYPDPIPFDRELWRKRALEQEADEVIIWFSLSGFFWWPRTLFGIEPHLLAFYDQPELMHRMNQDQCAYMLRCIDAICEICTPDFMTFAEDMSYNHGPMISRALYDEFMHPYYLPVMSVLQQRGIHRLIDSDGDIEPLIPWFLDSGIEGILPLERMAGVDVARIRKNYPQWKMIGGYDKTVMHRGEAAMRAEFERLLPVMRSGYFIPSVDHQTPPGVSLAQYWDYLRLLEEYTGRV